MSENLIFEAHNSIFCKLAPSPIHGVGVFAIKDIPENTVVLRKYNNTALLPLELLKRLNKETADYLLSMFEKENKFLCVPQKGYQNTDISYYLNHSEDFNIKVDLVYNLFVTKRDVQKGEELTINYKSLGKSTNVF